MHCQCLRWIKSCPDGPEPPPPVFPEQRTSSDRPGMSEKCHKQTHAAKQIAMLFDYLIGLSKQCQR
jgi:hypothetical protein